MFAQTKNTIQELFEQAFAQPEAANLGQIWKLVESELNQQSEMEQLELAGWAIARLADLHHQKAMQWLSDWETADIDTEPMIEEDWLKDLIQQTMHLDLSDLTRQPKPYQRKRPAKAETAASMAGEVEKTAVLEFIVAYDEVIQTQEMLAIAHDEEVSAWIDAVEQELCNWIDSSASRVPFTQLCKELHEHKPSLTRIKVWLALLLGGYELEQYGDFYLSEIWIARSIA